MYIGKTTTAEDYFDIFYFYWKLFLRWYEDTYAVSHERAI